jgi:starch phosphorylase
VFHGCFWPPNRKGHIMKEAINKQESNVFNEYNDNTLKNGSNIKIVYDKDWIIRNLQRNCMSAFGRTIEDASDQQKYRALALTVRDQIMQTWAISKSKHRRGNGKRVYYLSVEFLIGRLLSNNMLNLMNSQLYEYACIELGINLPEIEEYEPEPGLGNGGLGRLAACFMDSITSLSLPGMGCSIRYEFGLFRQKIVDGNQTEMPDDWLQDGNIWEVAVPEDSVDVHFYGDIEEDWSSGTLKIKHVNYSSVIALPYDIPIAGYDTKQVNSLRLWSARAPKRIDMEEFNKGEYSRMMDEKDLAEVISKVLYPEDRHQQGKELRLRQHYFLASATMQYIVRDYRATYGNDLHKLHEHVAVQINDTHPALAIPELMRILMDEYDYTWEVAERVTARTFAYTNHTVMSEALEKWDENIFRTILPRIYSILKEMNEVLCKNLWDHFPNQWDKIASMAIIAYGQVHMANLCAAISHTVNGVSQLHARILKRDTFHNFYVLSPRKFIGITNGITHRRWLMDSNPKLTALIDESIGAAWKKDPERLSELRPFTNDSGFLDKYAAIKQENKLRLAEYLKRHQNEIIDPQSIFDVHAKRLHEYKRQLLNILHVLFLYNKITNDSSFEMSPKTYIFAGKAAPGYDRAKLIIRLINQVGALIKADKRASKYLKVVFLENYCVSKAQILIPSANISEQISTAGKEASGTGNMKFMINGALTCGTMDGANVEMYERAGKDNIYIFGLNAEQVQGLYAHGTYRAGDIFESDPRIRHLLEQLIDGSLSKDHPRMFADLYQTLLFGQWGEMADSYLVLKDFESYRETQERMSADYMNFYKWQKMAATNTAMAGFFSSDRTISEYNEKIWGLKPMF